MLRRILSARRLRMDPWQVMRAAGKVAVIAAFVIEVAKLWIRAREESRKWDL